MSFKIQTPPAAHLSLADGVSSTANGAKAGSADATDADEKKAKDAAKVGKDFEAILVRQMLSQTKVAGKGGYADMAVESLATSITAAGGLGMGHAIEQSLLTSGHVHPTPDDKGAKGLAIPGATPISLTKPSVAIPMPPTGPLALPTTPANAAIPIKKPSFSLSAKK